LEVDENEKAGQMSDFVKQALQPQAAAATISTAAFLF
jgi:hypothetical protein